LDATEFDPVAFDFGGGEHIEAGPSVPDESADDAAELPAAEAAPVEGFRAPGAAANTAELLKFLIDRTGYIKQLEEEDTPEAQVSVC
jgi:DNA helicase-2/ATP-dependent DNA helicase PcrA